MKKCFFLLCVCLPVYLFSQSSDKEKAYTLAVEAVELMDNGEIDKSISLLKEACKLDPETSMYPYEIGYAYCLKEEYKKAVGIYKKVVRMKDATDQAYQMLGNAYDYAGNPGKAIESYQAGLKHFPTSGRLYLELGNMQPTDRLKALEYYEKGIEVDPEFPSNYYWASKIFCETEEKVWGLLYGELFMNIERGSDRTIEISKLLYDTYSGGIDLSPDTVRIGFTKEPVLLTEENFSLPFPQIFEVCFMVALEEDSIDLASLSRIREHFIGFYYDRNFNQTYPNPVFEWHKSLLENGFFEEYNHWLFMQGAPDEFQYWYETHQDAFDRFIQWFSDHPMPIPAEQPFHRKNY